MTGPRADLGPLDLLVIQPTPFCNIDCSYCYLPDRRSRVRMAPEVLDRVFERVFASGLVEHPFTVVWHAGEPLVLPISFYEHAIAVIDRRNAARVPVYHSFQTNGTLITQEWCDLIKAHGLRIGVSLDGPDFLHDAHRRTRAGKGTHRRVMDGIALLRRNEIPFHVIAVLTSESLDYPDEIYEFFAGQGIDQVGFNVEEIEGPHRSSSLGGGDAQGRFRGFLSRFFDLATAPDATLPLRVREFDSTLSALLGGGRSEEAPRTHEITPMAIVSVDCLGNFSTFSPELLGLPSPAYGDFVLGNVADDDCFAAAAQSDKFLAMNADIASGVRRCRESCSYFAFCGGGAPVNKYFENGTFDSTETLFCRLNRKVMLDLLLEKLERPGGGPAAVALPEAAVPS